MKFETIILEKADHIATLTLNRPDILNALNFQMFDELKVALKDINEDNDIRVMILTGAGRAFCAAADIKDCGGKVGGRLLPQYSIEEVRQIAGRSRPQQVTRGIVKMEKPTIAMVNGMAVADGFDWCLACDLRVGSEKTKFMNGFINMALFPVTGGTWLYTRRMPMGKALELAFTGGWLEAEEAYRIGVLNKLVPHEKLKEETMALAKTIADGPPASIKLMKLHMYKGLEMDFDSAMEFAADGEPLMLSTQDHVEALSAFLEKRKPKFTGK